MQTYTHQSILRIIKPVISLRMMIAIMLAVSLLALHSCRDDQLVIYSEEEMTGGVSSYGEIVGMYVLNEGNMGSNKCTLDYLDLIGKDGYSVYHRNIYSERNPHEIKELGDVGNDIQIYGSRLWMVINCSNKVEVATADSARKIGKIDIPNCRYVTFYGRHAYISSYVGPVKVSGDAPLGRVYKVDTLTLEKVDSVTVGYQPEQMAISHGRLYVANSGGYRVPAYDNTVSVIDLAAFKEIAKIEVDINLHKMCADRHGQVWVTSRGNNMLTAPSLHWLQPDGTIGHLDIPITDMCLVGDSLYYIGNTVDIYTGITSFSHGIIDVRSHEQVSSSLSDSPEMKSMTMPYAMIVNPADHDFYIMDAKNYVSSGLLYHFLGDGSFDWKQKTGDIPAHACFLYKKQ